MADISLRDYLGKLDTLLNQNAPSEVVHHCRHVLQYFPKNAETYRYLGRALVMSSSWEEAGEVFQRVLSVYPDDYTAHLGLSDVYLHLKRADDAIWHLERAFEQKPNEQSIIDGLRELYRRHRRVEQGKIQLTAGAVARQYIRNGLFEQAIDTLRQALERSPERADLRLLLAETYQEAGYRVEAAEVALEVLKVLPDCLEANRILTELWLAESRPSDAQRYLNRIQS
ncbi:MAG: tetratricopeptide repeat protein, partial [Anaerolineae bacterium]|nr:tetratricopeptide repeat protein [Anaerolineae bacterium]